MILGLYIGASVGLQGKTKIVRFAINGIFCIFAGPCLCVPIFQCSWVLAFEFSCKPISPSGTAFSVDARLGDARLGAGNVELVVAFSYNAPSGSGISSYWYACNLFNSGLSWGVCWSNVIGICLLWSSCRACCWSARIEVSGGKSCWPLSL